MTPIPSAEDLKGILATLDPHQAYQLQWVFHAFVDVLEDIDFDDLSSMTGLEQSKCNVISAIRDAVAKAI